MVDIPRAPADETSGVGPSTADSLTIRLTMYPLGHDGVRCSVGACEQYI